MVAERNLVREDDGGKQLPWEIIGKQNSGHIKRGMRCAVFVLGIYYYCIVLHTDGARV